MRERILLCLAHMSGKEMEYIKEAFDSNWVVPLGPNVNGFEADLEAFVNRMPDSQMPLDRKVVALSAGTAAVHLALVACGVGPGDEVMVQSFTFCASSHPVTYLGATPVVSDSGTLPEESSFFLSVGNPIAAVCIRTSTERPEALDKGDFILAGIDEASLLQAVDVAVEMNSNSHLGFPVPNYVDENVSDKIVKLIQSYTGVVNKMVWRKF